MLLPSRARPLFALPLVLTLGCSNQAPTLLQISSQQGSVGVQLAFEVVGADADGDVLSWEVSSETLDEITTRSAPAVLSPTTDQSAWFRWTPLATDLGTHELLITARDGRGEATVPVTVTVSSGVAVPVFREPLGSGTTLDLRQTDCVSLDVVVEDGDGSDVSLTLEEPVTENMKLDQDRAMAGSFRFCPSEKQIEGADRYPVTFVAEDRDANVATKKYSIVLRKELLTGCAGDPPLIGHTAPGPLATVLDVAVEATISDDIGVSGSPVVYFTTQEPADPTNPNLSTFQQADMVRISGGPTSGSYTAYLPNPVLSSAVGTQARLYYLIEASDNDDENGPCDHRTSAPSNGLFERVVERPPSGQGLEVCEPCSSDVQCNSGRCIAVGNGVVQCLDACDSPGASCDGGGTCSTVAWSSIDGAVGSVCLVDSTDCGDTCIDDTFEDNDSLTDPGVDLLSDGLYSDLAICPNSAGGRDDDWFGLLIDEPTPVTATVQFSHAGGDLDLHLLDEDGATLQVSAGLSDTESVGRCLDEGLYFLRVFPVSTSTRTTYDLDVSLPTGGCCTADEYEPNDTRGSATWTAHGDVLEGTLCPNNEDWYAINLDAGDTLEALLLFDQPGPEQDLDLHLHNSSGTDLTPCPPCDVNNGQSGSPDELMEYTVSTTDTYYVVVRGFEGASAEYLLGLEVR